MGNKKEIYDRNEKSNEIRCKDKVIINFSLEDDLRPYYEGYEFYLRDEKGSLLEYGSSYDYDGDEFSNGDSTEFSTCYNASKCYYLVVKGGYTSFKVLVKEKIIKQGTEFEDYFHRFGQCSSFTCKNQVELYLHVNKLTEYDEYYDLYDETLIENGTIPSGGAKSFCLSNYKCSKVMSSSYFYLIKSNEIILSGEPLGYRNFGPNCFICDKNPDLIKTTRGEDIMFILGSISNRFQLETSQYEAACWLIYDDLLQLEVNSDSLIERILQRFTIALLYFSTNGFDWKGNPLFLSYLHECDWNYHNEFGIKCNSNKQIIEIALPDNDLAGLMPHELSSLKYLEVIDLHYNELIGRISTQLCKLTNLVNFGLSTNFLSGTIPECFLQLQKLKNVSISDNDLTGRLPKLTKSISNLHLSNNKFTGTIPTDFENVTSLISLNLGET